MPRGAPCSSPSLTAWSTGWQPHERTEIAQEMLGSRFSSSGGYSTSSPGLEACCTRASKGRQAGRLCFQQTLHKSIACRHGKAGSEGWPRCSVPHPAAPATQLPPPPPSGRSGAVLLPLGLLPEAKSTHRQLGLRRLIAPIASAESCEHKVKQPSKARGWSVTHPAGAG